MRRMIAVLVLVLGCGPEVEPLSRADWQVKPEERRAPRPVPKLSPGEPRAISPASRALAHKLAAVDFFALGGISIEGVMSPGEELTLALSREPDAVEAFTWLGQLTTPAPRLYAYWALRTLAPDRAAALWDRLRQDRGDVEIQSGDEISTDAVTEVLVAMDRRRAMPDPSSPSPAPLPLPSEPPPVPPPPILMTPSAAKPPGR